MKTTLSIIAAGLLIGGAILLTSDDIVASTDNIAMRGGKQIVEITAKGRYTPQLTVAKADVSTIIRMKTVGTYDCSTALKIPSIRYEALLPASGKTDIEIPPQKPGTILEGVCAMGMYSFNVQFN